MSNAHPPPLSDEGYCARCDGIFSAAGFDKMRSIRGYPHSSKSDIERTAKQGCPLCQKIVSELISRHGDIDNDDFVCYLYSDRMGDNQAWSAWKRAIFLGQGIEPGSEPRAPADRPETLVVVDRQKHYVLVRFGLLAEEGSPLASYFALRPPETRVDSPHVIQKAVEWLKECRESHTRCIEHNNLHSFVPDRLLDVGAGSAARIYLRDMSAESDCDYAALSYCWGGPQPIMTTVANLQAHMTGGIPVDDLPATIQDAIRVVRGLRLQYLWIDALCIIQDNDTDKAHHIGSMGKVYRTATMTICASTAKAVSEGFLRAPRQPPEVMQKRLHLSDEINGTIGWAINSQVTVSDHPLDGRAWTMQEYFLSPRRLVYSKYELIWNCYTVGPRTLTTSHLIYDSKISDEARMLCGASVDTVAAMTPWAKSLSWRGMMFEYTDRSMTFSVDRLNAIVGIANEVCILWGDSHLYGLLRSDMILQLAWSVNLPTCDVQSDRGPSWAWISSTDSGSITFIQQETTEDMIMKPDACFAGVADDDQRRLFLEARLAESDEAKFPMVLVEPLAEGDPDRNLYPDLKNYKPLASDRLLLLGQAEVMYNTGVLSDVALVVREVEKGTYSRQGFVYFAPDLVGYDRSVWDNYAQQMVTLV